MYKNLKKISTKNMPHEEWLEHRRKSIGGSDASAIVGLNKYASQYSVWADKMGKLPPKEDNEPMRLGRDLEEYVAQRFTEATGKKLRRENNILINPDYPFAHANVDRMVIGEDAGFEAKTTSALNTKKFKNGEYPENYYAQCVHYLAITGCKRWYLGVLILGVGFEWFVIERDEDEIAALMRSEAEFWTFVKEGIPPMVDGSKATTEAISTIYAESDSRCVNLMAYEQDLKEYTTLSQLLDDVKEQRDEVANRIKNYMGEADRGESGRYKVTWSSSVRSTFDHKRFAADHPKLDLTQYYKATPTRTFKINEIKTR
jgi:putative phage-type endonuclease